MTIHKLQFASDAQLMKFVQSHLSKTEYWQGGEWLLEEGFVKERSRWELEVWVGYIEDQLNISYLECLNASLLVTMSFYHLPCINLN
jgi:hypothetical protein